MKTLWLTAVLCCSISMAVAQTSGPSLDETQAWIQQKIKSNSVYDLVLRTLSGPDAESKTAHTFTYRGNTKDELNNTVIVADCTLKIRPYELVDKLSGDQKTSRGIESEILYDSGLRLPSIRPRDRVGGPLQRRWACAPPPERYVSGSCTPPRTVRALGGHWRPGAASVCAGSAPC
jgi:hypothetical protein